MIRSAEKRNTRDYFPKLSGSAFYLAWRVTNDFVQEYQKNKPKNKNKRKTKEKQGKERKEKKKKQL